MEDREIKNFVWKTASDSSCRCGFYVNPVASGQFGKCRCMTVRPEIEVYIEQLKTP